MHIAAQYDASIRIFRFISVVQSDQMKSDHQTKSDDRTQSEDQIKRDHHLIKSYHHQIKSVYIRSEMA